MTTQEVKRKLAAILNNEHKSIITGYKIPVILSQYVVHLLGSEGNLDQSLIEKTWTTFHK
jgi:hypothetical protein